MDEREAEAPNRRGLPLPLRVLAWAVPATLFAAGAYELALPLSASTAGLSPGQAPDGEGTIALVAAFAMVVAIAAPLPLAAARGQSWAPALFAPSAAAFVVARYFTYDPYYFPTLRRYSDGGFLPESWVFLIAGISLLAGLMTRVWPRGGAAVSSLVIIVLLVTFLAMGLGH